MNHVWNGVYVNGRWYEIDVTHVQEYKTPTADATKRVKDKLSGYSALFSIYTKMYNCDIPDDMTVNIWLQKDSNTVY